MMKPHPFQETEVEGFSLVEVLYPQDFSKLELQQEPYDRIVAHHPGSRDYSIRDLIDCHVRKNGWGAIGYHFCIGEKGEIFYTRSLAFKGAHAFPNTSKVGVAFLRSFARAEPNGEEITALGRIRQLLGGTLPIYGHNQDQLLELMKTDGIDGTSKELLQRLSFPRSERDFELAQQELYRINDTIRFQEHVARLKTCPGAGFYQALQQKSSPHIEASFQVSP